VQLKHLRGNLFTDWRVRSFHEGAVNLEKVIPGLEIVSGIRAEWDFSYYDQ
jgi:hypothetical protein